MTYDQVAKSCREWFSEFKTGEHKENSGKPKLRRGIVRFIRGRLVPNAKTI